MENVFSLPRFWWLLKKTLLERPTQMIGLTGLSLALSLLAYGLVKIFSGFDDAQNAAFMIGLTAGGCFLASFVYGQFASNASGSSFLTLPASQFEKWLAGVVITGALFMLIFLLFFRAMDTTFVYFYHRSLDPQSPFYTRQFESVRVLAYDEFIARTCFIMFFNFAGMMLVGSLFFNKAAFIKVALIACAICLGIFLLNLLIAGMFLKNVQTAFPYYLVWIWVGKDRARLELPPGFQHAVRLVFQFVTPAILWSLAYLRLTEKEF